MGLFTDNMADQPLFKRYVQIGRVCYDQKAKSLCVIANVMDQNKVLVVSPNKNQFATRYIVGLRGLTLTDMSLKLHHSARNSIILRKWSESDIEKQWADSSEGKKIAAAAKRHSMTDFDKFLVKQAKKTRNNLIRQEMSRIQKKQKN